MRVLIVDDNPIYVALLKNKLRETNVPLQIVGSAANIPEALHLIYEQKPDVLILDIDLETTSIFDLFEDIDYKAYEIIFATGFDKYAVSAFDVEAIGYLVKPVITSQLEKFLLVAKNNLEMKSNEKLIPEKETFLQWQAKPLTKNTISVPFELGFDVVAINHIHRCEAINSTTHIFLEGGKKLISSYNIGKFIDLLSDKGFYPVHRSHLVNLSFVKRYLRSGSIVMADATEVPLSKANRHGFISMFSAIEKVM